MTSVKRTGVKKQKPPKVSKSIKELLEESARDDLIVTPAYNQFLNDWDENYPDRVVKRIGEVLSQKQRDRSTSWSASGAGKCKRRQELQFLGMPVMGEYNPQQRRIFLNGTWVHLRNQAILMAAGILDNIEVTVRKPSQRVRCTLDGMGVAKQGRYEGAHFGYELKSRNENAYNWQLIKGVDANTRKQVDFEFLLTGMDLFVIFNEQKNNQDIHEWVIIRDEDRVREVAKEVKEMNKAIEQGRLHPQIPECQKQLRGGEFFKCPYGGAGGACVQSGRWPSKVG